MATTFDGLNLNRFRVFVAVVEAGSITGAAVRLALGKTVVSNHIQRLERELGVSLLVRNTRRMALTESGKTFYELATVMLENARHAVTALGLNATQLTGTLRISAPVDYGSSVLTPALVKLQTQHSNLTIDLHTTDRYVDLIAEGVDAAVRLGNLADSNMHAVKVDSFRLMLVACPTLIAKLPKLTQPRDLTNLPLISFSVLSNSLTWAFEHTDKAKQIVQFTSRLSVNSAYTVRSAALLAAGLAVLQDFSVKDDLKSGRLVHVLPGWALPSLGVYVVFPESRFQSPKIRVLIDQLKSHLKRTNKVAPKKASR